MKNNWRTYSVFVSSTFADMHAERDYLRTKIFPEINDILRKYCVKLRIIDLRWGINTMDSEEGEVEKKVLKVCLDEIQRSKPFFLGLLGNRYGWIPSKELLNNFDEEFHDKSITEIEMTFALLQQETSFGCWFIERENSCYEQMSFDDLNRFTDDNDENKDRLISLKEKIKRYLSESNRQHCYVTYSPKWDGKTIVGLEEFGTKVKNMILDEILQLVKLDNNDPFSDEQNIQDGFLSMIETTHYDREIYSKDIVPKIESSEGVFALLGDVGVGKSHAYYYLYKHFKSQENILLYHSTNVGQKGKDVYLMLSRWIYILEKELGISHVDVIESNNIVARFINLMYQISLAKSIVMLIDGVERFYDSAEGSYLNFFPRKFNKNLRLICTCNESAFQRIQSLHKNAYYYSLSNLLELESDVMGVISKFMDFEKKEIYRENIVTLLNKNVNGVNCVKNPIWLSIAINYMMSLDQEDFLQVAERLQYYDKSYDKSLISYINERIASFHSKPEILFAEYLQSLDVYYGQFPTDLIKFLSVSYNGLEEDVLANLFENRWDSQTFACVRNFLQDYLSEQTQLKLWSITHDSLKIQMSISEERNLCQRLAEIYVDKFCSNDVVNDNICFYLIKSDIHDLANRYFLKGVSKNESRLQTELFETANVLGCDVVVAFLSKLFSGRKSLAQRKIPMFIRHNFMKRMSFALINKCVNMRAYGKAMSIIDVYEIYLQQESMLQDIRIYYKIHLLSQKFNVMEKEYNDIVLYEEYKKAFDSLKIKGLLTLFFVPLFKKYYKWRMFNLKK